MSTLEKKFEELKRRIDTSTSEGRKLYRKELDNLIKNSELFLMIDLGLKQ